MGNLHDQDLVIRFKRGLVANINATATKNLAVEGEPHWATDTDQLYIYDGAQNVQVLTLNSDGKYELSPLLLAGSARVWRSMELVPDNVGKPAANPPAAGEYQGFTFDRYDRATVESVFFIWHVPTDFCEGDGSVRGQFGFFVENPPVGSDEIVVLSFEYKQISPDDVFDFTGGTLTGNISVQIDDGEPAYTWHVSGTGTVTTTGWSAGDIIMFRFFRNATSPSDTYDNEAVAADNDVWVGGYHLEYLTDRFGEAS